MLAEASHVHRGTAMASAMLVDLSTSDDSSAGDHAVDQAVAAIERVATTCSRFVPTSDLSRLNETPDRFVAVDDWVADVVGAAYSAYQRTGGRFDPRVLEDLERLGYRQTFSALAAPLEVPATSRCQGPWQPRFSAIGSAVNLGGARIDLGGIAKGWAVDRASEIARGCGAWGLTDLGGDGRVTGPDAEGQPWSIGIEDPHAGSTPVATISLSRGAYATSSTRIRSWKVGDKPVHHLIDPVTGEPGGAGLSAVTMIAATTATAEVDAKVAFLSGRDEISTYADRRGLAALWVTTDGDVEWTRSMADSLTWVRS